MAELSFELQKLPPSALDVLRFFHANGNAWADDIDIMDGADLSERSFSKAIKRLITKKFATMDAARNYQLTEKGKSLLDELIAYDNATGNQPAVSEPVATPAAPVNPVSRHLVMVIPQPVVAGESNQVFVGLNAGSNVGNATVVVRLMVMNGELDGESETAISLQNGNAAFHAFRITPDIYTQVRLRLQAFQLGPNPEELHEAGGMYVDVDVIPVSGINGDLAAYGTDIHVLPA